VARTTGRVRLLDNLGELSKTTAMDLAELLRYALGMEKSRPVEITHPNSGGFPTLT
jgi:hypothetical protein